MCEIKWQRVERKGGPSDLKKERQGWRMTRGLPRSTLEPIKRSLGIRGEHWKVCTNVNYSRSLKDYKLSMAYMWNWIGGMNDKFQIISTQHIKIPLGHQKIKLPKICEVFLIFLHAWISWLVLLWYFPFLMFVFLLSFFV
jgi:hypothetical protein